MRKSKMEREDESKKEKDSCDGWVVTGLTADR